MARGACNCGAVAFEIDAPLKDVYVCHCSICRRATGSGGIAIVLVEKAAFHWLSGQDLISIWEKPAGDWRMDFCKACGSPLPGPNDETRMFVPAGLITQGGEDLAVVDHIWVGSKAGWDVIGDAGKQHPGAFSG